MNIYLMICKKSENKDYTNKMFEFISANKTLIDSFGKLKIIQNDLFIIESKLPEIDKDDVIIWDNTLASKNIDIVKHYQKSIVLLEKRTVLTQKQSKFNPITENMAINHNFKIMYISDENDITNEEWSLVVPEENYVVTVNFLNNL